MRSVVAALLYFCACQTASSQGITLRYAQAFSALRSIFALPLLVAEREGYFVREGLNFSMVPVPGGGEKLVAVLHDGSADISHVATPHPESHFTAENAAGASNCSEADKGVRPNHREHPVPAP